MSYSNELVDVYPYARKCHLVYRTTFQEIFCGNNPTYSQILCQTCIKPNSFYKESIIFRCRLCYVVSCESCGNGFPKESFKETQRINKSRCGRYTLVETTAKTHLGNKPNSEDEEDFKCDECFRQIGHLKNGDYAIVFCNSCFKVFCQYCKNKHMDQTEKNRLLAWELILKKTCSMLNFQKTFCKQFYPGFEGDIPCSGCKFKLGSLGNENKDFLVMMCRACRDPYCLDCYHHHKRELCHVDQMKNEVRGTEEMQNKFKNIIQPKCGSEFVYLTSEGKSFYMYCGECKSQIYVRGMLTDNEDTLLNKCSKCKKFLCLKCKDHFNQKELNNKRQEELWNQQFAMKYCSNLSPIMSSFKTLFPEKEEIHALDCENCSQPIIKVNKVNELNMFKECEENLPDDDYKIFNCRACNKKLCENCSIEHTSKDYEDYLNNCNKKIFDKDGEMLIRRKFMRYKFPCDANFKTLEVIEIWPSIVNQKYDVHCNRCKIFISTYTPFYSCLVDYCEPCKVVLCKKCQFKHNNVVSYSCSAYFNTSVFLA